MLNDLYKLFLVLVKTGLHCFLYLLYFLQMIKMGSDVETVLRETVLQVEHVGENKLCMSLLFSVFKM